MTLFGSSLRTPLSRQACRGLLLACAVTLFATACAPRPEIRVDLERAPIELTAVPFFPQEEYQCGPAALAEVLQWTGADATPEMLAPAMVIPAREGSLQIELLAQARVQGRVPFEIDGELRTLQAELAAGNPVIVLQNLAFAWRPLWHYAVVIGVDPETRKVILRSGREHRHVVDWTVFERTWARGGHWAVVVLKPGDLPATATVASTLAAAAPFEQRGEAKVTEALYRSAAARWPDEMLFRLGIADSLYTQGRSSEAEQAYRELIGAFPADPVAYNNLALVLADAKRWQEAKAMVEKALQIGGPLREEFLDTQRRIRCRGQCDVR
jgi:tetratricopeptide (TPR) repeat protein